MRLWIRADADNYSHIEITPEHNGNLFFWHYQNRHIANRQRTVIWLNGGPGCSSEDGALMEIGPYRVKDGSNGPKLEYNDGSWDEFANILFVDNPVGTGFSFVDTDSYVHELPEMADQFMQFLERWFALFPEYEHDDVSCTISYNARWLTEDRSILPANLMQDNTFLTSPKQLSIETKLEQSINGTSRECSSEMVGSHPKSNIWLI